MGSTRARRRGRSEAKYPFDQVNAMNAYDVVEQTARDAYGRLVSFLAINWRDIDAAQDAISDAFLVALETWPRVGVPDKPEAWLLTAARRKLIDQARRNRIYNRIAPTLLLMSEEAEQSTSSDTVFPDERLKMLFLCAHPGIDPKVRTPLMLQTVLGIDAARIASVFTVKPSTMGQRLTRAKTKIRSESMLFNMPDAEELPQRLDSVLEAIFAAYGTGWDEVTETNTHRKGLTEEAIYLGRLLSQFMPHEPEVQGLLALMLHLEARRDARLDESGNYVPLSEHNPASWSKTLIQEAESCLNKASQARNADPYGPYLAQRGDEGRGSIKRMDEGNCTKPSIAQILWTYSRKI
ncbi:sigma factor [Paenibacillus filicis]|uniref:Sigma factor n=1 Tax=Paenibacillus gyeongsangnamensis TaxID=3388067 RepID=A0ABT4Q860_9BACL|nr:DUF6596 domain-containing protein [Paenibacillus filicis]MCZ8513068.1 sigma factor [Paenibacillus filicis]